MVKSIEIVSSNSCWMLAGEKHVTHEAAEAGAATPPQEKE